MKTNFLKARQAMIESQIETFSVIDQSVIDAFLQIERQEFVGDEQKGFAYIDEDLVLGGERLLVNPAIYARLLQELSVKPEDQILDLCCGTGYSSAILAKLGAHVTAVDYETWVEVAQHNEANTHKEHIRWVSVENPEKGCPQYGPYDAIVVNGGVENKNALYTLSSQLRDGGKIATIYYDNAGLSQAMIFVKKGDDLISQPLFDAFVPILQEFQADKVFEF